jgi:hypothetical protein
MLIFKKQLDRINRIERPSADGEEKSPYSYHRMIAAAPLEKQRDASRSRSHNQNRLSCHY